ncbi:Uncharacterized protein DAT39_008207, partial [Clarias magur]
CAEEQAFLLKPASCTCVSLSAFVSSSAVFVSPSQQVGMTVFSVVGGKPGL